MAAEGWERRKFVPRGRSSEFKERGRVGEVNKYARILIDSYLWSIAVDDVIINNILLCYHFK